MYFGMRWYLQDSLELERSASNVVQNFYALPLCLKTLKKRSIPEGHLRLLASIPCTCRHCFTS